MNLFRLVQSMADADRASLRDQRLIGNDNEEPAIKNATNKRGPIFFGPSLCP
jgi:hypothetical protein